jgi:hypothetical protein
LLCHWCRSTSEHGLDGSSQIPMETRNATSHLFAIVRTTLGGSALAIGFGLVMALACLAIGVVLRAVLELAGALSHVAWRLTEVAWALTQ